MATKDLPGILAAHMKWLCIEDGGKRAELSGADLSDADLSGAYLLSANLSRANLSRVNLVGANKSGANFLGATFNETIWRDGVKISKAPIEISDLLYRVFILEKHMQIGCELHTIADWQAFDDRRIAEMDGKDALKFWRENKAKLLAFVE